MSIRKEVREFVEMGPLPESMSATEEQLKGLEVAFDKIKPPVTPEEAALLVTAFGPDDCFEFAWSLLHLIETAPRGAPITEEPAPDANEWVRRLWDRLERANRWNRVLSMSSDSPRFEKNAPTYVDVMEAMRALDGVTVTLVTLSVEGDVHMGVGGGKDDQCVVYLTKDNRRFKNLEDPSKREGKVLVVCAGQEQEYPARQCVSLRAAWEAASWFALTGEAAPRLCWVDA